MAISRSSRLVELPDDLWFWLEKDLDIYRSVSKRIEGVLVSWINEELRAGALLKMSLEARKDDELDKA